MSERSRRDLLKAIAAAAATGPLSLEAAQHVHGIAADEKLAGGYKPKALTLHEFKTLQVLADLIVPADEHGPSAAAAGVCEFIDLLASQNPQLLAIYTGGIAWLDRASSRLYSKDFVTAAPQQQTALLDLIAYRKNESPILGPGIRFFDWARRMVVDAYYTSPAGIKAIGYLGNTAVSKFEIPQEAIDYALKRSPV
ncbi:MAG TPA: gluconate 2-dehydrogenase subunit 3 family protein [Bryobacteraceae bacterium]|nr:gluconate 2-dehydrogenase subunit 3 family protein [Bryobacteraceae bacterium]